MESDFLKTDIGRTLEWGLLEDLIDSEAIFWNIALTSWANPSTSTLDTGTAGCDWLGGYVRTGDTSGSDALLEITPGGRDEVPGGIRPYTFDRGIVWKATCRFEDSTEQEGGIGVGRVGWDGDFSSWNNFGFYILNDELHMNVCDGSTQNHELIQTFGGGDTFVLEAKHYPGSKVDFYVDGSHVGSLASNLPSGDIHRQNVLSVYLTNTEAVDKRIEPLPMIMFLEKES